MNEITLTRSQLFKAADLASLTPEGKRMEMMQALRGLLPEAPKSHPIPFEKEQGEDLSALLEDLIGGGFGNAPEAAGCDEDLGDFFSKQDKCWLLHAADHVTEDIGYMGEMFAVECEDTGRCYLLDKNEACLEASPVPDFDKLGLIVPEELYRRLMAADHVTSKDYSFFGAFVDGQWMFHRFDKARSFMTLNTFTLINRLFSRNTGLFECEDMLSKTAVIIGAGSVGSLIALQLARAGVGRFVLVDGDTLEVHNICRHQLGFRDLGRYKVDAMKQAILNINPYAKVEVFRGWLQDAPAHLFTDVKNGIVVGTADNRAANAAANDLAAVMGVPFAATGCWSRCHAGEVFYWKPGSDLPTYRQAFAQLLSDERPEAHQDYFGDDSERLNQNFEPGTADDLAFVTEVSIKVILDLLGEDSEGYTTRVLDYLTNYTLVCNTNKPQIGGANAAMFPYPLFISSNVHMLKKEGEGHG